MSDSMPRGTVTFLFTDIEGSTRLWEDHPEAMTAALKQHDAILRSAIEAQSGYIFKTVGDAFYAAFEYAPQALQAAIEVQRGLQDEAWDAAIESLPVRMALHTGNAEIREGDYFGQPLNRVARLESAGHGGQILLSLATQELVRDDLPQGVALVELGTYRLKDLYRPEKVYQVNVKGLPDEFPPLRTLESTLNNLPAQPNPFVGRERELAAIKGLIGNEGVRLVTLTGPGGTGKTRISLQVAADMLDAYEHGVWFVDLAPITEGERVAEAIGSAFGLKEGEIAIEEMLTNYLKSRSLLLVLDNYEQVIDAAGLVGDLLSEAPGLNVIVTSREMLNVYGEHEYPVPPLGLPETNVKRTAAVLSQYESVALFIQRGKAASPSFDVTEDNAPAIAEICVKLDGLPLAIELAAARVKLFAPEALLTRLEDRLKTLTGGARNLPKRQQTIYNAIEWSYDLLDEEEKALFARLGVFQGGRSFEAVEVVCMEGLSIDALEGVESLQNKSLIRQAEGVDGEPRFVMLETIHEFARRQLEERGESETIHQAHATFYGEKTTKAFEEYRGARQPYWNTWLDSERENIRTALDWLIEAGEKQGAVQMVSMLMVYWYYVGYHRESFEWYERVKGFKDDVPVKDQIKFLIHGSMLLNLLPTADLAIASYKEGLELARQEGERYQESWALAYLGASYIGAENDEEYEAAVAMTEESIEIARELNDLPGMAHSFNVLGELYRVQGEREKAREAYLESLDIVLKTGEKIRELFMYENLGFMAYDEGRYEEALTSFKKGVRGFLEMESIQWVAVTVRNLAASEAQIGDAEQAARLMGAGEKLMEELGIYEQAGDRSIFDQYERDVRELVGDERYEALAEEGHAMTRDDVLAFVREVIEGN